MDASFKVHIRQEMHCRHVGGVFRVPGRVRKKKRDKRRPVRVAIRKTNMTAYHMQAAAAAAFRAH